MEKVLIAGGTGLLGSYLAKLLSDEGFQVGILSRKSKITTPRYGKIYYWNPDTNEIDPTALTHVNYIINLAGENIAEKRWTTKRKHELLDSRLKSTNFLFNLTKIHNLSLKAFVTASAIGYYGTENSESICQESDSVGTDFSRCNQSMGASGFSIPDAQHTNSEVTNRYCSFRKGWCVIKNDISV